MATATWAAVLTVRGGGSQLDGFELIKLKTASSSRANLEHGAVAQGPAEDKGPDDPDDTAWEVTLMTLMTLMTLPGR